MYMFNFLWPPELCVSINIDKESVPYKVVQFLYSKKNNIPFVGFRQVQEGTFVNTSPQSSGNQDSSSCSTMSYLLE